MDNNFLKNFYTMALETGIVQQLIDKGYMLDKNSLSQKGIQQILKSPLMKEEELDWIEIYRNKFSKDNIGISGKMDDLVSVRSKMKRFQITYGYTKEVILNATDKYLQDNRHQSTFISSAGYFIFKQMGYKSEERSLLAGYCEDNKERKGIYRDL